VFERDGFRHDAGPTIITAPFLIDELFALFGRRRQDYVSLIPLDPWYRFHFHDGSTFNYGGTIDNTLAEIRRFEPADADGYLRLLDHARRLYEVAFTELADRPFDRVGWLLKQAPRLALLRADQSVWTRVCGYLRNDKLRRAFSVQPLLIGGNPFSTTSIYLLIHHLERNSGVFFAQGGTGALAAGLARLIREQGIEVRLQTTVERVLVERGRAVGVMLASGERLASDIVVSNADPSHLYREMVSTTDLALPTRVKLKSRLSMGLFIVYFGTRRRYEHVAHNTIWLGQRYRELLDDIFKRKVLAEDFSLYLHRPTATDPSFAPPGCDSYYALCPVPNNTSGIDWTTAAPLLKARIVNALERTLLPGLSQTITADFVMTPDDFAERHLSFQGSGFATAPNFLQSAWFRFHNASESIDDLYLVGAGTHPGAGIPGVLCTAKVVDELIARRMPALT
jgi:phytoene desaturase